MPGDASRNTETHVHEVEGLGDENLGSTGEPHSHGAVLNRERVCEPSTGIFMHGAVDAPECVMNILHLVGCALDSAWTKLSHHLRR